MVKTPEFTQFQSYIKDDLEKLLSECNRQLTDEVKETHNTTFGTLEFVITSNNDKPCVRMCSEYNNEFVINGIAYKGLSCYIVHNWENHISKQMSFTKVDSWNGTKYNDIPTEAARNNVHALLDNLCDEVYHRLSKYFDLYVERESVLATKQKISNMIRDLSEL